jgi:hypothetical protein
VSPLTPPGGARETPPSGGSRDDWQRRERATARRARRAEPQAAGRGRADDADPYGWSTLPAEGQRPEYPPGEPPRGRGQREPWPTGPAPGQPVAGRPDQAPAGPRREDQWRDDPRRDDPRRDDQRRDDQRRDDQRRDERDRGGPRRRDDEPPHDRDEPTGDWDHGTGDWDELAGDEAPGGRGRQGRPHKRRAASGQQTGLDPSQQSDLPTWLQERGEVAVPVRRLLSLSVAGFAALLGFGLLLGAYALPDSYGFVIFGVQVLFVLAWTVAMRPAGAPVVAAVGLFAAVGADVAAVWPQTASLASLAYVTVVAFVAGVIGQLLRGSKRLRATESLGATLIVVIGVVSFATVIVLNRHPGGTQSVVVCLAAAGVALVVARLTDIVLPTPRASVQVPRGSIGVVLGAMAGTVAAGVAGSMLVGLWPSRAVIAGLVTATAAVLADLAVSYAEASRELDGEASSLWVARHMQGPLGGLALAAPAAYVLSVLVLVPNL